MSERPNVTEDQLHTRAVLKAALAELYAAFAKLDDAWQTAQQEGRLDHAAYKAFAESYPFAQDLAEQRYMVRIWTESATNKLDQPVDIVTKDDYGLHWNPSVDDDGDVCLTAVLQSGTSFYVMYNSPDLDHPFPCGWWDYLVRDKDGEEITHGKGDTLGEVLATCQRIADKEAER